MGHLPEDRQLDARKFGATALASTGALLLCMLSPDVMGKLWISAVASSLAAAGAIFVLETSGRDSKKDDAAAAETDAASSV